MHTPKTIQLFAILFQNYMYKLKAYKQKSSLNSAFECGKAINFILKEIVTNPRMQPYQKQVNMLNEKYFQFFCKCIINCEILKNPMDVTVKLQNMELKDKLSTQKLMVFETFYYILLINSKQYVFEKKEQDRKLKERLEALKNKKRGYSMREQQEAMEMDEIECENLIEQVNTCTWHVFMIWFIRYRTNNIYQNIFYNLMRLVHSKASMGVLQAIYWKLNMFSQF